LYRFRRGAFGGVRLASPTVRVLALCAPLRPGYGVLGLKRRRVHLCLCRCAWFPAPWWLSRAAPL